MTETNKSTVSVQERLCPDGYKICDGYNIPNEWSVVRFNSLFRRLTRKNTENNQNVLTISAQQGLVSQMDYYNTLYASENKEGYSLLHKGDFSYNKSYSSEYAYGAIKRLDTYDKGIVSPLYICFTPEEGTNSDYYLQYFEAGCFNREIYKIAQEGARNHGLLNVSTDDFFNSSLVCPPLAEQERIAEILTQCDKVIELKQKKTDELTVFKKECLRRLFPANGCTKPEVRFPGFTDDWEQRELVDLCSLFTDGDWIESKDQSESGIRLIQTGNIGVTKYLDKSSNKKWINDDTFKRLHCTEVLCGDILISRLPDPAGRACIVPNIEQKMITAVDCTIARIAPEYSSEYIVQYLATNVYFNKVNDCLAGGTRQRISRKNLADFMIPLPSSKIEQQQIGAFFKNLDHLITLHQQELNEYKTYKNTLAKLLLTGIVRVSI